MNRYLIFNKVSILKFTILTVLMFTCQLMSAQDRHELNSAIRAGGYYPYRIIDLYRNVNNGKVNIGTIAGFDLTYNRFEISIDYIQNKYNAKSYYNNVFIAGFSKPVESIIGTARFNFIPIRLGYKFIRNQNYELISSFGMGVINWKGKNSATLKFSNDSVMQSVVNRNIENSFYVNLCSTWKIGAKLKVFFSLSFNNISMTSEWDKYGRRINTIPFQNALNHSGLYLETALGLKYTLRTKNIIKSLK